MPTYCCTFQLPSGDRALKRKALISYFLDELAGTGNGNYASRYEYTVETYGDYGIYLKRPTRLNKGFDFTVNISGMYFKKNRRYSNPSHSDIIDALASCRDEHPEEYGRVKETIIGIYNCEDVCLDNVSASFRDYEGTEHPIQIILLAVKWLFMEQDCAYWNYSGRKMLMDALANNGLV